MNKSYEDLERLISECKLMLNKRDEEIEALKAERDALAAQVEVQNDVIKYAHNKLYILSHNRNDVSARCIGDADKAFKVVDDYLLANKTPQQCLRDVQAEAGRKGYLEAALNFDPDYDAWWSASQYAESVRQGTA